MGRFINSDSLEYLGDGAELSNYNLFAYCGNNPVMGYDPEGTFALSTFLLTIAIGGIIGAAVSTAFEVGKQIHETGEVSDSRLFFALKCARSRSLRCIE